MGWLEMAGVFVCNDEESYKQMNEATARKKIL